MILRQFVVYIGVGILTALLDIGTMQALLLAGTGSTVAVSAGFTLGLVFNYFTHLRVTFKATGSQGSVLRFGILVLLNYGLTLACVELGLWLLDSVLAGKLLSLPVVAVNGFLLGRYWVFRKTAAHPER